MKKFLSTLAIAGVATVALASCNGNGSGHTPATENYLTDEQKASVASTYAGEYDFQVWVSESKGVTDLTAKQIRRFESEFPGIKIKETLNGVTEANAATQVIADVASAPDLYCFPQDQLARLVQVSALDKVPSGVVARLKNNNDKVSIEASTVATDLYCYPLTSDNGYFMFYDKSVIDDKIVGDLDAILAKCEDANRTFCFEAENAWYNAAFFFGVGCKSDWTTDKDGKFTGISCDYNSAKGIVAMNALKKVTQSSSYIGSSSADQFAAAKKAAVVISGTWASAGVKEALGDNYAAAELPSWKGSDGQTYHMGSFSGNKLIGVKPQADAKRGAVAHLLAEYLTLSTAQLERFDLVGWGPSNKVAQEQEKVQNDPALKALAAQGDYAKVQGNISGVWWDIAKALGTAAKTAKTDADLQTALDTYDASIADSFEANKNVLSVIGKVSGTSWDTDFWVYEGPKGKEFNIPDGTYYSEKLKFEDYEEDGKTKHAEYKLRASADWDLNWGSDYSHGGPNFVVETPGEYYVKVVVANKEVTAVELVTEKPAA